jgi:hypothetical protein
MAKANLPDPAGGNYSGVLVHDMTFLCLNP